MPCGCARRINYLRSGVLLTADGSLTFKSSVLVVDNDIVESDTTDDVRVTTRLDEYNMKNIYGTLYARVYSQRPALAHGVMAHSNWRYS